MTEAQAAVAAAENAGLPEIAGVINGDPIIIGVRDSTDVGMDEEKEIVLTKEDEENDDEVDVEVEEMEAPVVPEPIVEDVTEEDELEGEEGDEETNDEAILPPPHIRDQPAETEKQHQRTTHQQDSRTKMESSTSTQRTKKWCR